MNDTAAKTTTDLVRLNFNAPKRLRDRLRMAAAMETARKGHMVTMGDLMMSVLEEALDRFEADLVPTKKAPPKD